MTSSEEPAAVRAEIEDLMHRVDELDAALVGSAGGAVGSAGGAEVVAGAGELALLGRQGALFERAHQRLVDTLDDVDRG